MIKYTFTFEQNEEAKFKKILARLEDDEYNVIEEISLVDPEDPRYSKKKTVIEMDPEACLTIRMGMKEVVIRRERTEEELAEEKANEDRHKVKINVIMPSNSPTGPTV